MDLFRGQNARSESGGPGGVKRLPRPELTTTKGSARPEGGREAPALGGGSGAARFAGEPGGFLET